MENYIKNVAGTSMGAFFCLAFALKIPVDELEEIVLETIKLSDSVKSSSILNIFTEYGFNDTKNYILELKKYAKKKYSMDDITFIELSKMTGVNLYVSTTRVNDGKNIIFNVNDYPNISVFDVVGASMCIPCLTKPVKIGKNLYVDGCISNNLQYDVFRNIDHRNIYYINMYKISNITNTHCPVYPNSYKNFFNEDNILNIAIYVQSDYDISNLLDRDEEMNFFEFIKQVLLIIYSKSLYSTYVSKVEKLKNPLLITESPITTFYNLKIDENEIKFNILREDLDNLTLQGFRDINNYMKQFLTE